MRQRLSSYGVLVSNPTDLVGRRITSQITHYESTPLQELAAVPHQDTAVVPTAEGAQAPTPGFCEA